MIKHRWECLKCNSVIICLYEIAICDSCGADLLVMGDNGLKAPASAYIEDSSGVNNFDLCEGCHKKAADLLGLR